MSTGGYDHQPVLLDEVLNGMNIDDSGIYVDCTYGRGGHTRAILARLGSAGRVLAMDRDPDAVEAGAQHASQDQRLVIRRGPFTMLSAVLQKFAVNGKVNGLLFDLGSPHRNSMIPAAGLVLCARVPWICVWTRLRPVCGGLVGRRQRG